MDETSMLILAVYECSTYSDKGEEKNMAATQFEAVDARRCFPCWDEPALKVIVWIQITNFLSNNLRIHNPSNVSLHLEPFLLILMDLCLADRSPPLQATFKITLENIPSELTALSNMPISEEKVYGHLKTVHFEESILMSTYLVAVVVGLFDYVEDTTNDGTPTRSRIYRCFSIFGEFLTPICPCRNQSPVVLSGRSK